VKSERAEVKSERAEARSELGATASPTAAAAASEAEEATAQAGKADAAAVGDDAATSVAQSSVEKTRYPITFNDLRAGGSGERHGGHRRRVRRGRRHGVSGGKEGAAVVGAS